MLVLFVSHEIQAAQTHQVFAAGGFIGYERFRRLLGDPGAAAPPPQEPEPETEPAGHGDGGFVAAVAAERRAAAVAAAAEQVTTIAWRSPAMRSIECQSWAGTSGLRLTSGARRCLAGGGGGRGGRDGRARSDRGRADPRAQQRAGAGRPTGRDHADCWDSLPSSIRDLSLAHVTVREHVESANPGHMQLAQPLLMDASQMPCLSLLHPP